MFSLRYFFALSQSESSRTSPCLPLFPKSWSGLTTSLDVFSHGLEDASSSRSVSGPTRARFPLYEKSLRYSGRYLANKRFASYSLMPLCAMSKTTFAALMFFLFTNLSRAEEVGVRANVEVLM